jgi:AsmA protein
MKIAIGLLVLVVLLVGGVLSLPFLIDLNKYQDQYKPIIEEALNRQVQLQDIRLTIWPRIGASVAGFSVLDDPSFDSGPFASLSSLDVGVKLMPLLSGQVEVEEITLRDPVITVIKNKNGVLNVSTIGRKGVAVPEMPSRAPVPSAEGPLKILAMLAVDRVSIDGGKLTYRDLSAAQPTEYVLQDLELLLREVRLGQTPNLHFATLVQPFNLPVKLDGSFGPLKDTMDLEAINVQLSVGKTDFTIMGKAVDHDATITITSPVINTANLPVTLPLKKPVDIKNLTIVAEVRGQEVKLNALSLQIFDGDVKGNGTLISGSETSPFSGAVTIHGLQLGPALAAVADMPLSVGGAVGADLAVEGQGASLNATATIHAPMINAANLPGTALLKKPVEIKNLQMKAELKGKEVKLNSLSFQLFDGQVKGNGKLVTGSEAPPFNGAVTIQGLQLGPALASVAETPVSVSGTAGANLSVQGRGFSMPELTKALQGTGRMAVKDGKIQGVNILQEVVSALKVAGISIDDPKATVFSTIETDLAIKQGVIRLQNLLMDSHDFQATGGGTIGFDQRLNLLANLNLSQQVSQKLSGASPVVKIAMKDGRLSLPLTITGTAQAPSYGVDVKGLTGKVQEQVKKKVEETVEGLLKGTTKPEDLKREGQELLKGLFGR